MFQLFYCCRSLFVFVFCLLPWRAWTEPDEIRFKRLSIKDGLSQGTVSCILQDKTGFMWFGTEDGLNRFDGYDFKIFRPDPDNPNTLPAPDVTCLLEDKNGVLWIGSFDGGLSRFHRETEIFENYLHNPKDPNSLSSNLITDLLQDKNGMIWVSAQSGGLCRFNPETGMAERFEHSSQNTNSLSSNALFCLYLDEDQKLWIGGSEGLDLLDIPTGVITRFQPDPEIPTSLPGGNIRGLARDRFGHLWVSMRGRGIARYDSESESFFLYSGRDSNRLTHPGKLFLDRSGVLWSGTRGHGLARMQVVDTGQGLHSMKIRFYGNVSGDLSSLSGNDVQSIFEDRSGILWIGVLGNGVNRQDHWSARFNHYREGKKSGIIDNMVWAVATDEDENLWVGTDSGLTRMDPSRTKSKHYIHSEGQSDGLGGETALSVYADRRGDIWIGCWNAGLDRLIRNNGEERFVHYRHKPGDLNSLSNDFVYSIAEDNKNRIWIGTASGISILDEARENFQRYRHNPNNSNSLSHDEIVYVYEDPYQRIWACSSGGGLNLLSRDETRFTHFSKGDNPQTLDSNTVNSVLCTAEDVAWAGTNGGLNKLVLKNETAIVTRYGMEPGHPRSSIYRMHKDGLGRIWMSGNKGLTRFDPETEVFRIYDAYDGLQSREFNAGASFKSKSGEMFFGGVNGLNAFFPEQIVDDKNIPNVVLTEFLLANRPVKLKSKNPSSPLTMAIDYTDRIVLTYKQNVFSFHFAALHYAVPENQQYAYMMDGFDEEWVQTDGKQRVAAYTNLNPGHYTFKVKGSNHDGAWNDEPASVKVVILPPPWLSWWAKLIYGFVFMVVVVGYLRYQQKKLDFVRTLNERQNQVNERLKEMDRLKDDFLANTSHELRTPLNGIIGLAESLLDESAGPINQQMKHELMMIVSGGKRLGSLVNDILDFSRLKNRNLTLHLKPLDLHTLVNIVLTLSKPLTSGKSIVLKNETPTELPPVLADENRLQQILHNLIGNGIKFTESGSVIISAECADEIYVHVKDTGVGIAQDQLGQIFESFEQVGDSLIRSQGGTGLGLAITKQLVTLHQGKIWVKSTPGVGSIFSFSLPMSSEPAQFIVDDCRNRIFDIGNDEEVGFASARKAAPGARILIVDDEPVNRRVLRNMLTRDGYEVVEAGDGPRALQLLEEDQHFDMALLDVMMPRMSGYDVCEALRKKFPIQDLPVIFLTARDRVTDLMTGFNVGGNDFLTKPISKGELLTRVRNHLALLDVHRNLDTKVKERTRDLDLKNQELAERNSEIIHTQNQLILNEKMATLGTLAAGVAHEINNPNNFVSGGIQRLKVEHERFKAFLHELSGEDEEICRAFDDRFSLLSEMVRTIEEGSFRIGGIVKNLSQFTQLDESEHKSVNVLDGLRATVLLLQPSFENVHFQMDLGPPLVLDCWPGELNQVFMNLLLNACEALCQNGEGEICIWCDQMPEGAYISFKDNGPGIAAEHQDKLFEAFFTTKKVGAGTGLGLYTSYQIMEKHGGRISCVSELGKGALFQLFFPNTSKD